MHGFEFASALRKRGGIWSTLEVFIGFCQIATLFVSVTADFDDVVQNIFPYAEQYGKVLSLLSLNVPAWLSLDCLLSSFYSKWTCKAVGVRHQSRVVVMLP